MGYVTDKNAVKIESYVKKLLKTERPKSIINLYQMREKKKQKKKR